MLLHLTNKTLYAASMFCLHIGIITIINETGGSLQLCKQLNLSFCFQNEVPDAEPECDPLSVSSARSLWGDRMALAGSNELTIEVQDYIPFSQ